MSKPNRFYVVDLDRTTFRTKEGGDLMTAIIEEERPDIADLVREGAEHSVKTGNSFSIHALMSQYAGEAYVRHVENTYLARAAQMDLLHDGAREFFAWLDAQKVGYGILTYGGEKGQRLKLQAAGLSGVPTVVTSFKHKGEQIASWQQPDGTFTVADEFRYHQPVDEIILIDDRRSSFMHLPGGALGYWVTAHATDAYSSADVPLPDTVRTAATLHDVVQAENHRLKQG